MEERAPEAGFVPFTPRRVPRVTSGREEHAVGEIQNEPQLPEQAAPSIEPSESLAVLAEPIVQSESGSPGRQSQIAPANAEIDISQPIVCDHRQLIRNEAIRLAAIACGRALRHVAVAHPQAIASFVDEAFAAAGRPTHHSTSSHLNDATLEFGEVVIQCDGSRVGADIETRAELLVRAAAER